MAKRNKLPKSLTTVTTFSKLLAIVLFILLPFAGFYVGMQYLKQSSSSQTNSNIVKNPSTGFSVLGLEQPRHVVLLYGWHGTVASWDTAKAAYEAKGYIVDVLSLPRNGDTLNDTKVNATFTDNYISGLGLTNVKLDGHSLGGWVALYMTLVQRNTAVSSVVLRDTGTGCFFGIPPDQCVGSSDVLREINAAPASNVPVLNLSSKSDKLAGVSCLKVISGISHTQFQTDPTVNSYAIGWSDISPCLAATPTPTTTTTTAPTPTTTTAPTLTPTPTPTSTCTWYKHWRKQC